MKFTEHLFISDVHLGAFTKAQSSKIEHDLISLIDYAIARKAAVYVLGDLFDYWMEFPKNRFVPAISKIVLDKFEEYNSKVMRAVYITGNHDNWTFGHFAKCGFDVEPDFRIINIAEKNILLMHGDGHFDSKNNFYRPFFHNLLRNKTFVHYFQAVSGSKMGLGAMRLFSDVTRKRNYRNPKSLNQQAQIIFSFGKVDSMICGHDHIPRMETFINRTYINLGTFYEHRTIARSVNGSIKLVKWNAETKEFQPFGQN